MKLCSFCDDEAIMVINQELGTGLNGYGVRVCWQHIPVVSEAELDCECAASYADDIPLP